jgi:hypothetical protein
MKNLLLLSVVLVAGCVNVPRTTITGSIGGKPFTFSGPKDCSLGSLVIAASTNGEVTITVSNLQTKMNPEVITTTGAAQTAMIKEILTGAAAISGTVAKP